MHPRVHVTSVRISGGMVWLLLLPALILGVILLVFGIAAAGVLGFFVAPWLARRHHAATVVDRARSATTIELEQRAYRRVEVDERP